MSLWRRHKDEETSSLPEAEEMRTRILDKLQKSAIMETEVTRMADKLIEEGVTNHFGAAIKISFGLK